MIKDLKVKKVIKTLGVTLAAVSVAFSAVTQADVISFQDLTQGQHSANVNGTSVTAWNDIAQTDSAVFGARYQNGQAIGMGVKGHNNNELDFYYKDGKGESESIAFDFESGVVINELTLGLLFNGPEYSNEHEIAEILIDGHIGRLELDPAKEDSAKWYVDGVFVSEVDACNVGATLRGGTGCFSIINPFGNFETRNMDLTAAMIPNVDESDYLFQSTTFTSVPEPGTLALFLIGAAGLVVSRRAMRK